MCANSQSNWLKYHRSESFIHFTYFEAISLVKTKKNRGDGLSPPGKNQISEMACGTTARCSRGYALNSVPKIVNSIGEKERKFLKYSIFYRDKFNLTQFECRIRNLINLLVNRKKLNVFFLLLSF